MCMNQKYYIITDINNTFFISLILIHNVILTLTCIIVLLNYVELKVFISNHNCINNMVLDPSKLIRFTLFLNFCRKKYLYFTCTAEPDGLNYVLLIVIHQFNQHIGKMHSDSEFFFLII